MNEPLDWVYVLASMSIIGLVVISTSFLQIIWYVLAWLLITYIYNKAE